MDHLGEGFSFLASLTSTQFWSWDDEEAWLIKQGEKPAPNNALLMTSSSTLLTYKYFYFLHLLKSLNKHLLKKSCYRAYGLS